MSHAPHGPDGSTEADLTLEHLRLCFEGAVPAVIATAAGDGTPNVTYLSRVRVVDAERVALSNQFFSKTTRNLAENPRASLLVIDPRDYGQYRLTLAYERTERRGVLFEQLRDDVDLIAALSGMQEVFKLRAADVYRVESIEFVPSAAHPILEEATEPPLVEVGPQAGRDPAVRMAQLAELTARLARCPDLDTLVGAVVEGLDEHFGFGHSLLLLRDERGEQLFTVASHGYQEEGVGSEVPVGDGIIGLAAERCRPVRVGNFRQMRKYSRTVRTSYEDSGTATGREIPVPGLADAESRLAVPASAFGQPVGVLAVESTRVAAFDEQDEALLGVIASTVAAAVEASRDEVDEGRRSGRPDPHPVGEEEAPGSSDAADARGTLVRFFPVDGSTFLDGDYLIKGVAGRILWALLGQHHREGRVDFTNREVRLDPTLELPEYRDNLESRLILLKRRLDEREAPVRITRTGRGRFRLDVHGPLRLEEAGR